MLKENTVIPATQKVDIRRIVVRGQPWQKISETPISTNKQDVVVTLVIPATQEGEVGELWSKAGPRQKHKTFKK
jgi:hypothetical protein